MTRSPRLRIPALAAALVGLAAACSDRSSSPTIPIVTPGNDSLLAPGRVGALPPADRPPWSVYIDSSRVRAARDRAVVDAEVGAAGLPSWVPAPLGPDFQLTSAMTDGWFAGAEARRIGSVILSFQTPTGGWSKAVDVTTRARLPGESWSSTSAWDWISTFDNGATTEELRFLGAVVRAQGDSAQRAGFLHGVDFVLAAQFPNGCWPQVYPLEGWYHDAVTYNDGVMVHVLQLLGSVARGDYAFVPTATRGRAAAAVDAGVRCIVASQVAVGGRKTIWGAQQDPLTLAPVEGRAYEPPSLCSLESAGVMDYLMQLPTPAGDVVTAVHAAAAWLRAHAIYNYLYLDRTLTPSQGAGPLWARFYELGTNRPIFGDRDGSVHYVLTEISLERQLGYAWYTTSPAATLARYDAWARAHP